MCVCVCLYVCVGVCVCVSVYVCKNLFALLHVDPWLGSRCGLIVSEVGLFVFHINV